MFKKNKYEEGKKKKKVKEFKNENKIQYKRHKKTGDDVNLNKLAFSTEYSRFKHDLCF